MIQSVRASVEWLMIALRGPLSLCWLCLCQAATCIPTWPACDSLQSCKKASCSSTWLEPTCTEVRIFSDGEELRGHQSLADSGLRLAEGKIHHEPNLGPICRSQTQHRPSVCCATSFFVGLFHLCSGCTPPERPSVGDPRPVPPASP